tara:strand:- start:2692 stop:3039 length:348 start_codon:yes stop_codon:yes gene_type:complete
MNNFYTKIVILVIALFSLFTKVYAAEILQVSSSTVLLIGDNNRTYTVELACTEIDPNLEERSVNWLRKELPRHTKVNLKPKGAVDGVLVAKVIPFNSDIDITEKYINEGLATNKC